jgi:Na+/H+ antiporter NhaC
MLKAERRRLAEGDQGASGNSDAAHGSARLEESQLNTEQIKPSHWINALLPIAITVAVVVLLIYATGLSSLANNANPDDAYSLREIVGAADSSVALQYGSLVGLVVAVLLCRLQNLLDMTQIMRAIQQGAAVVIPAIAILWFASALSRMTGDRDETGAVSINESGEQTFAHRDHRLYTGAYLASIITGGGEDSGQMGLTLRLLPTITFVLAGVVSFCTGTSFGTMGMLIPLVLTLCYSLLSAGGEVVSPNNPLLLATLGGVLAGAVFGDHCSPISDTTILSSQACGCDHIAHVITQLPYAMTMAAVAIVFGTLPIGWGVSPLVLLPLQFVALIVILCVFGKKVEAGE